MASKTSRAGFNRCLTKSSTSISISSSASASATSAISSPHSLLHSVNNSSSPATVNNTSSSSSSTLSSSSCSSSSSKSSYLRGIQFIDAAKFVRLIERNEEKILIIDSRSFLEYNTNRVKNAINVSCSKIIKRRLQHDKLSIKELLSSNCGIEVDNTTNVIVYDSGRFELNLLPDDTFTNVLLNKLKQVVNRVSVVIGGFLEIKMHAPDLCEDYTSIQKQHQQQQQQNQRRLPLSAHHPSSSSSSSHHHLHPNHLSLGILNQSSSSRRSNWNITSLTSNNSNNNNNNNNNLPLLTSISQPCLPISHNGPTRILPFLYLGSQYDAQDKELLNDYNISYELNVSVNCPKSDYICETHFLRIPVNDSYTEKLLPFFPDAFRFLDKVKESGGCAIVHCLAGISRSATVAIAYVMRHLKMSSDDAYRYVKSKRASISPNFNFLGQLLEYETDLKRDRVLDYAANECNASGLQNFTSPIIIQECQ